MISKCDFFTLTHTPVSPHFEKAPPKKHKKEQNESFVPSLPKCRTPTVATSPKKQCFPISHRVFLLLFLKAIAHKTRYAEALQISLERRSFLLRKLLTAPAMWPKGALTEAEREQHAQV